MKPTALVLGGMILVAALALAFGQGQTKLTVEPDPSFAEDAISNHRHPEVDTDVSLYINHWRNSIPYEGHGGFIERDILTSGDPLHPPKKGAVLKYIKAYKRAALEPRFNTRAFKSAAEQVFVYVCERSRPPRIDLHGHGRVRSPCRRPILATHVSERGNETAGVPEHASLR